MRRDGPVTARTSARSASAAAPAVLSVQPTSGRSGTLVILGADLTQTPTTCTLEQDGTVRQTFPCGPNSTIPFTVSGQPGQHTLTVCAPTCTAAVAVPSASAAFTVLAVVPPLLGLSESAVPRALAPAGLKLDTVTGPAGATMVAQDPPAGRAIDPDRPVNVSLGVATTTSSAVVVTRASRRFVVVPDLGRDSPDAARATLAGAGLTLSTTGTTGTIATQNPRPGQRVAAGATVTVTLQLAAVAASSTTHSTPGWYWAIVAAALVLLALAGRFIVRRARRRRAGPPPAAGPPPRVTCRATVDTMRTGPTRSTAPTVQLRVRAQTATLTMERTP